MENKPSDFSDGGERQLVTWQNGAPLLRQRQHALLFGALSSLPLPGIPDVASVPFGDLGGKSLFLGFPDHGLGCCRLSQRDGPAYD